MSKVLTVFSAEHYPADFHFMMDSDDPRLGVDYLPVATDCWFQPERSMLVTEFGEYFHVDGETWEASEITFKKGRKG
jgi:hypothetical protein